MSSKRDIPNSSGEFVMPFGKYTGRPLSEISTKYLDYVLGTDNLWESTENAILTELNKRTDWNDETLEDEWKNY